MRGRHPIAGPSPGFTALEMAVVLGIAGILVAVVAATLSFAATQAPKESGKLALENEQQLARYWIPRDANNALTFTPGTSPTYGTFTWVDYRGEASSTYAVRYYYDPTIQALMREEKKDGVVQDTFRVASNILQESDVVFSWSSSQGKVDVSIAPTIQEAPAVGDVGRTATLTAWLRLEEEPVAPTPGEPPTPTPPPGAVTYYIAQDPTVLEGTYISGDASSLRDVDNNFYRVRAAFVSFFVRRLAWEGVSETITTPATIGSIEVRFTGQVNRGGVTVDFFVKGPSGYPTTPNSSYSFTQINTNELHSFTLDAATVAHINSTRTVELKVRAIRTAILTFDLRTDQVAFVVGP